MNEEFDLRLIDRLVDDEMSDSERRALLLACEEDPRQWRAVALCFVESQILRQELSDCCDETIGDKGPLQRSRIHEHRSLNNRIEGSKTKQILGMAAAVLCAVGLGFGVGNVSRPLGRPANEGLAGRGPAINGINGDLAAGGSLSNAHGSKGPLEDIESHRSRSSVTQSQRPNDSVLMLVRDGQAGRWRNVQLPLRTQNSQRKNSTGSNANSDVSPDLELIRYLRDHGHGVQQTIELHPFELEDGRMGVIPISNVQVNVNGYQ